MENKEEIITGVTPSLMSKTEVNMVVLVYGIAVITGMAVGCLVCYAILKIVLG